MRDDISIAKTKQETSFSALSPRDTEQLAALRSAWSDCVERERISRQAISNLSQQIEELNRCISDAKLRAAQPIPFAGGIAGIAEHAKQKRLAIDESESLSDAKEELLKQLARLEQEFRGYQIEKSGVKEGLFRLHYNDILSKNKSLFARIAALGMQLGLTEGMIAGEMFYDCQDNLNDLIHELGILS